MKTRSPKKFQENTGTKKITFSKYQIGKSKANQLLKNIETTEEELKSAQEHDK